MKLFERGSIGKLHLQNRIVMAPMGIGGLAEADGSLGQRAIDYFTARAKGGTGLIITGMARVSREVDYVANAAGSLGADGTMYMASVSELADAVHDYGAKVAVQLTVGRGRNAPNDYLQMIGAVAPSPIPCFANPKVIARELSVEEIERLVQSFGIAAEMLLHAGIDAIEIHAHGGYLLDQFQTALWNKRTDRYGGDLEGRLRFAREIIEAIKKAAGRDFPVIYRFGLTHFLEGGREVEEGLEITRRLETAGVDAFHIDAGCYETRYWSAPPPTQPPGCMVDLAHQVKKGVKVPVIAVGRLGYPELAERVLQEGKADFIALGRALLADPDWPNKVRDGKYEEICPCIGCYEGCLNRIPKKRIGCAVNPVTGMEREFALKPAERKKFVLVVGGGPAGLEAARVAALRGHKVSLWEKGRALGGNLIPASAPSFKKDFKCLIEYLTRQIQKLGVAVELEKEATPERIQAMKPDALFIATGSTPAIPEISGIGNEKVATAGEILLGKREAGGRAVVIGGGLVGCETALYLAEKGKQVTIVEMTAKVASDMFVSHRLHILKCLYKAGAEILTEIRVLEIMEKGVRIGDKQDEKSLLETDTVVLATGMKPTTGFWEILRGKIPEIYFIGDCVEPRKVMMAIWEGFRTARLI